MPTTANTETVKREIEALARDASSAEQLMTGIVNCLHERMLKYNWVGFYMIEKSLAANQPPMLVLGPFAGAMTPHTRIPLNQGICGAAATSGKTVVVDDVNRDARYLACSIQTKSEIVAPVFLNRTVAGERDIDSHLAAAFTAEDRELVEYCAVLVGKQLEKSAK